MTEIIRLAPHDPIPSGPARHVIVLHRFDEDAPQNTITTITLTGHPDETTRPMNAQGKPMNLDQAIAAAQRVAESEGLPRVFVIDRTAGERERDILQHGGDHSVHMEGLVDFDLDEGECGPDMRDRTR
ncbi:MAG TPA: hypothetical protein VE650_11850 [Acetobacteraceae bacterium]|nr:hypothetical protein [Acetobacteraceae bacterium]